MKKPKKLVKAATPREIEQFEPENETLIRDTRPGGIVRPNAEGISIYRGTIRHGK